MTIFAHNLLCNLEQEFYPNYLALDRVGIVSLYLLYDTSLSSGKPWVFVHVSVCHCPLQSLLPTNFGILIRTGRRKARMQCKRQSVEERLCQWERKEGHTKHCPLTPHKLTTGEYI